MVLPYDVAQQTLQYLSARPYSEVASIINNNARCLQDQVIGQDGEIKTRGGCPEIATTLNAIHSAIHSPQTDVPPAAAPEPAAPAK